MQNTKKPSLPQAEPKKNGNRDIAVNVDYEVKYQRGNILSIDTDEAWVSACRSLLLQSGFGGTDESLPSGSPEFDNYVEIANESIIRQMKEERECSERMQFIGVEK